MTSELVIILLNIFVINSYIVLTSPVNNSHGFDNDLLFTTAMAIWLIMWHMQGKN